MGSRMPENSAIHCPGETVSKLCQKTSNFNNVQLLRSYRTTPPLTPPPIPRGFKTPSPRTSKRRTAKTLDIIDWNCSVLTPMLPEENNKLAPSQSQSRVDSTTAQDQGPCQEIANPDAFPGNTDDEVNRTICHLLCTYSVWPSELSIIDQSNTPDNNPGPTHDDEKIIRARTRAFYFPEQI